MIRCDDFIRFVKELYNKEEVFLHEPVFSGREKEYLADCIDSTFVSSVGAYVDRLEVEIARYTGSKYAVATVNGTAALHVSLLIVGVKCEDEVITQPVTFVATCNAIKYCGAEPVFVDVDKNTLGMNPENLLAFLKKYTTIKNGALYNRTTGRRIKACLPVHTFGHPCRIDEIVDICSNYGIVVVEDAAEALGSSFKNKHAGTFGRLGVLSFNGNKIITTGGGGAILTDDEFLAQRARHLTKTAKVPHPYEYFHDEVGFNYRMPNINAALGLAQLEQLERFLKSKRGLAKKYEEFFSTRKGIEFAKEPPMARSNYWLNAIFLENEMEKKVFLETTNKNKVYTRPVWTLMYKLPMYESCFRVETPESEEIERRVVNLPSGVLP